MPGPIARVAIDLPLPHLDRPFDYSVPDALSDSVQPGVRVRVRFSGRLVDAIVLERADASDHTGRLAALSRVISPVPVVTPAVMALARAVADRYAGTLADVLRAAVPPRHARAEAAWRAAEAQPTRPAVAGSAARESPWDAYAGGAALRRRVSGPPGTRPRAVWTAGPGEDWAAALADLAATAGGGVALVVPDGRDARRLEAALSALVEPARVAVLTADLGPQRRYAAFLSILDGRCDIVVGTRAAAFAPVRDLTLAAVWDDGDESLVEPHAPYWSAREVLALRAHAEGCALVAGGFARSLESQVLVESGWARAVTPLRAELRAVLPRVVATGDDSRHGPAAATRIPDQAFRAAREGLTRGPVLVQVMRRDYVPGLACQRCREPARCAHCSGPLRLPGAGRSAECGWCGRVDAAWSCVACGDRRLRATAIGAERTVEELGRAFPDVAVRTSRAPSIVDAVGPEPCIIVATPGAEPRASGGYAAVLLLDAARQLERPGLRAGEESARRWFAASALAAPGAPVVVTADPSLRVVQGLMRWDPAWLADRELAQRRELGLPPAVRVAALTGVAEDVADIIRRCDLPDGARVLGPVAVQPGSDRVRAVVTVPRASGMELARRIRAATAIRSARRTGESVEVRMDPFDLGV